MPHLRLRPARRALSTAGAALDRVLTKISVSGEALRNDASVSLRGRAINASDLRFVADELCQNGRLGELDMAANGFGEDGAEAVADVMRSCPALASLTLDNNNLRAGAAVICEALAENTGLRSLRIPANVVGPRASSAIADAIAANTTLEALDVGANAFGAVGGIGIARALANSAGSSRLRSLDLTACAVGVQSSTDLAQAFSGEDAHPLERLDMTTCFIGPEGLAEFAAMLRSNTTMRYLSLNDNNIGQLGDRTTGSCGTALAEALSVNTTLEVLDLSYNGLTHAAMGALLAANAARERPIELKLEGNGEER